MPTAEQRERAAGLLRFIDASPSPWHAVATAVARLQQAGFTLLDEREPWQLKPGGHYAVVRGGSSLIAFVVGSAPPAGAGIRIVGAHTDSPGLRLKPNAPHVADGMLRLGVEVYGGPILASFADRDLGLAGRVAIREGGKTTTLPVRTGPVARLANLAIHMNREVNESGLRFHRQNELPLLMSVAVADEKPDVAWRRFLAAQAGVADTVIADWELGVYDTQPGAFWGPHEEFIAAARIDNLASCHAAVEAISGVLESIAPPSVTCIVALFDHEEVGSGSAAGAGGSFLSDVVARLCPAPEDRRRALSAGFFVSADMAHAWHPNYPAAYEPQHRVMVNAGPVIKTHVGQRYSTGAESAARFAGWCESAGVPVQAYSHRSDLGCGSTIGPIVAAQLGMAAVDVGCPMWSMHSARESAGVADHDAMTRVLYSFFAAAG